MSTSVIITDFINNRKIFLLFAEQDYSEVISAWLDPSKFFTEVKSNPNYTKYSRWGELSLPEWNNLVIHKLSEVIKLSVEEQFNEDNPYVLSLHFYLIGFCHKYLLETGMGVDFLRIQNINDIDFNIIIGSSGLVSIDETPPRKPQLKVLQGH